MKTINLKATIDRHSSSASMLVVIAIFVTAVVITGVGRVTSVFQKSEVRPTASLPIYVMMTPTPAEAMPTAAPPTPDQALRQEVEQLRARVAELEAQRGNNDNVIVSSPPPQPEPVVIIQQVPVAAPTMPQPTPEPEADKSFAQSLIGSDPNAKACTGANGVVSPLCGGLTNQQAQQALDQR
jgi:hypothetical protein